jgi:hypothetical protein
MIETAETRDSRFLENDRRTLGEPAFACGPCIGSPADRRENAQRQQMQNRRT